jgi:hypothetical protein
MDYERYMEPSPKVAQNCLANIESLFGNDPLSWIQKLDESQLALGRPMTNR